jgi:hypothetical protein
MELIVSSLIAAALLLVGHLSVLVRARVRTLRQERSGR